MTRYTGHFYKEEFMVTWSDGLEITGLPLMYSYWGGPSSDGDIRVIDAENHYYSEKYTDDTDPINLVEFPIRYDFADIPFGETSSSGNLVTYKFTPFSGTSEEPVLPDPEEPIVFPVNPGEGSELNPQT